jgi:hypothetical protein
MFESFKETYEKMFGTADLNVYDQLKEAQELLKGDPDELALYNLAFQSVNDDIMSRVGEMDRVVNSAGGLLDQIDVDKEVGKEELYFVLENGLSSSGNSYILDPKLCKNNMTFAIKHQFNNSMLGFMISIPHSIHIDYDEFRNETIQTVMSTHLCVSLKHRQKEIAKYSLNSEYVQSQYYCSFNLIGDRFTTKEKLEQAKIFSGKQYKVENFDLRNFNYVIAAFDSARFHDYASLVIGGLKTSIDINTNAEINHFTVFEFFIQSFPLIFQLISPSQKKQNLHHHLFQTSAYHLNLLILNM